ncbi:cytochrome B [Rubellimicrobium rubrum]|uniref:Cytochrome B n=1 Tax=Rubellimicrobium rubrum TaxID=2585369 RepID=A0A5C4MUV6_9RHOB|nr:cytochrome B [Rubellimicrobium rubrum]TNC48445.1 cytochrome B [Rubellimicrobium rubrum]
MAPDRHPTLGFLKSGSVINRIVELPRFLGALFHRLRHPSHSTVVALTSLALLPACVERLSALHPAGPAAETIATLWWGLLAGATAIFLLVMALLLPAFRRREPRAAPDDRRQRLWLWGLGLAFPSVVLATLTGYGLVVGERLLPHAASDLVTVTAEARQWEWRFGYADRPGQTTENVLHIPAGRPVDVQITSLDVIHSFWVPRLAGKLDAIPGHVNVLRIEATRPGTYRGLSAEFSGEGYLGHTFRVEAHDPASWGAFLRGDAP